MPRCCCCCWWCRDFIWSSSRIVCLFFNIVSPILVCWLIEISLIQLTIQLLLYGIKGDKFNALSYQNFEFEYVLIVLWKPNLPRVCLWKFWVTCWKCSTYKAVFRHIFMAWRYCYSCQVLMIHVLVVFLLNNAEKQL